MSGRSWDPSTQKPSAPACKLRALRHRCAPESGRKFFFFKCRCPGPAARDFVSKKAGGGIGFRISKLPQVMLVFSQGGGGGTTDVGHPPYCTNEETKLRKLELLVIPTDEVAFTKNWALF